ncbi:MAG TPA: hypothetical protein VF092_12935 [Longimicrobium sp.]
MLPSRRASAVIALFLLLPPAAEARAQCEHCAPPSVRGEALSLAGNALIGGVTAGIGARLRGRPFLRAFAGGAAGGAVTYAGKRIAAEHVEGAGFAGREVAAVGSSISANAAAGRGALDRLVLPVGPVRVYLAPRGEGPAVRARVDLAAVAAAAFAATARGSRFDARESLSSGALVFRVPGALEEVGYDGRHLAGVVQVRQGGDSLRAERTGAHERVHVIQYDQSFILWAAPAEAALMDRARWSRGLHRWIDLGINAPALAGLGAVVPYRAQPWETEAVYLARTSAGEAR